MSKVLVSMPKQMLDAVDRLVSMGYYASRSEAIRDGLRLLFQSHEGEPPLSGDELMDFVEAMGGPRDFSYS
ncbi:MAG: type II toxin-antitoxin system ParD family antitoxin [Candidatus Diapherotrites archaeon]|nr:type II toxin-antitoxin system ParD family antitoxin [Candidatus Diapherotrites archaeon]